MNLGTRTLSFAFLWIATFTGSCEEAPDQNADAFPRWAFCVVYQVRDADLREARPVDPDAEKDPFHDEDTWVPLNLLHEHHVVDVAALSTRVVKSRVLDHRSAEAAIRAMIQGAERHPMMDCYDPHHLFVFYCHEGAPVAALEVCFSCSRVKMSPDRRGRLQGLDAFETADLAGLAKVASDAGLELSPFDSLDAYTRHLDQRKNPAWNQGN